ncbi:MAG: PAS domain-containing sensor histidine kinase [Chryseolinea sp.]
MEKSRTSDLITSEAYREIFHSMAEGIIMVDVDGKIVVANPVAEQLFAYPKDALIGLTMEVLLPVRFSMGHANFRHAFNARPQPRRMGAGRDLTALRKDGTEFPVEISLSFTKVKDELLVMAFISDISWRKKTEDALKRSEEQLIVYAAELEKKVEMRTEALNNSILKLEEEVTERKKAEQEARRALEKEKELNELKSNFVTIASHEFRTPLSSILSSASLIHQYNERQEPDKLEKHVKRIKSSVNHLTGILNDFLSLGKLEEGKIELIHEEVIPQVFLDEVKEEIVGSIKPGQSIVIDCQVGNAKFVSDGRVLQHILFNLITNASKYSEKEIHIVCKVVEDSIVFEVIDQGIGIPKDEQKYMFDRFFRAKNAGNVQGTGLGLNIVKRYVELLQGSVVFTSQYGEGSTFTVSIPLSTQK